MGIGGQPAGASPPSYGSFARGDEETSSSGTFANGRNHPRSCRRPNRSATPGKSLPKRFEKPLRPPGRGGV